MESIRERLVRAETRLDQIYQNSEQSRAELKEHFAWQRETAAAQEKRIAELERGQEETRTHLRWVKGIWAAVQGAVLGWVGLK